MGHGALYEIHIGYCIWVSLISGILHIAKPTKWESCDENRKQNLNMFSRDKNESVREYFWNK